VGPRFTKYQSDRKLNFLPLGYCSVPPEISSHSTCQFTYHYELHALRSEYTVATLKLWLTVATRLWTENYPLCENKSYGV